MNKTQALHEFYSSFGLKAYEENSVPDDVKTGDMPYITYETITSSFDMQDIALSCQIFCKSNSMTAINAITDQIAEALRGGAKLQCDTGWIMLYQGVPFAQSRVTEDKTVKAKYINITADYITL